MEEKLRKALEARFPDELVRQRRGSFGKDIRFIEANFIIARLNELLDWSFEVVSSTELSSGEILVHGRLTALGVTREAFGKSSPAVSRESGEIISLADSYSAAATSALKKCASLLGIASYLTSEEYAEQPDQPQRLVPRPNKGDITPKQLSYLFQCAKERGLSEQDVREMSLRDYGSEPERLSKATASKFIERILAKEDRGAA